MVSQKLTMKKKFIIQTSWTGFSTYEVYAESEEQAKAQYEEGNFDSMVDDDGGMYQDEEITSILEVEGGHIKPVANSVL